MSKLKRTLGRSLRNDRNGSSSRLEREGLEREREKERREREKRKEREERERSSCICMKRRRIVKKESISGVCTSLSTVRPRQRVADTTGRRGRRRTSNRFFI